jgi:predicted ATPase/class 3 adenylate cyclase
MHSTTARGGIARRTLRAVTDALPTGTVTFLFTDVEGSTRLLDELGAAGYAVELARHRRIVRGSLAEHGGVEVDTQGDAFFCAFGSARAAVACAAEIQNALSDGQLRVRIGVHTGEALVVDRHYVGIDVHRAARIGACGHGGQVVVSPATVALLEPGEMSLRDLGAHRLKDLAAPVVLHQLGDADFPPLKTLYRTNLPVPATPFLGREQELGELVRSATAPGVRVLTLTGPGGTGKTRLSLQLAAELSDGYPDGVWWVPLAPLRGGDLVASAVASVLSVEEESDRAVVASIASSLARKRTLLLLDNCEHVVEAVASLVAAVVGACPDVVVVATSREPLAVRGEQVFAVEPLAAEDAVELFHARARAAGARLDATETRGAVTALCSRLDNLPLAVELAAARAAVLPPAALLERLATRIDVLTGPRDAEERQRTLRAAIAWSYDLLEDREQQLFRRLGVFVGGASLAAIEGVCDADLEDVLSVVSKSLARQASGDGDEPRYWMLETIREFAAEELAASGELDLLRARHLEWFVERARSFAPPEPGESLGRFELDLANFRAAFSCAEERGGCAPGGVALALALESRHFRRGRYAEAEDVARRGLALRPEPLDAATLHNRLGVVFRIQGRPRESLEEYRTAERILDDMTSRDGAWWDRWLDLKLNQAGYFYFQNDRSELERVTRELEPAVAAHGTQVHQCELLHVRARHRFRVERYALSEETEALVRRAHAIGLEVGDVTADFTLGFCLLWRGKLEEAETYLERGRDVSRADGVALVETRSLVYGLVAKRMRNDVEGARARLAELEELDELHGYTGLVSANAAWIAYRDGDADLVRRRGEDALADWQSEGRATASVFEWAARYPLLGIAVAEGDHEAACQHARAMLDPTQQSLPTKLADALERALDDKEAEFARALRLARPGGYV